MKLRMPAPVKTHSHTKKAQRKARSLPYDGSLYSSIPNGISSTHSYEPHRNLLTSIVDAKEGYILSSKTYSYDAIARPTERTMNERADTFAYDSKSQLTAAQEPAQEVTYDANTVNQYTAVNDFTPEFDADGNQTRLQTSTGIWTVEYNAENRPTKFTSEDGNTIVEALYDYMGRRAWKKVTTNGAITKHERYLYRGPAAIPEEVSSGALVSNRSAICLQIACIDLSRSTLNALCYLIWDPSEPTASRPLALQRYGSWFTFGLDISKNVKELFNPSSSVVTTYDYSPFGAVSSEGSKKLPLQWSSEIYDEEIGLVYYNYRHYTPQDGRWINRDPIAEEGGLNLYGFVGNRAVNGIDLLSMSSTTWHSGSVSASSDYGILTVGFQVFYKFSCENAPEITSSRISGPVSFEIGGFGISVDFNDAYVRNGQKTEGECYEKNGQCVKNVSWKANWGGFVTVSAVFLHPPAIEVGEDFNTSTISCPCD